jgi:outer membrane protein assembly factor BamE (lipoprotein component of BamABCDE complex)
MHYEEGAVRLSLLLVGFMLATPAYSQVSLEGKNSEMTQGNVQLNVKVGATTKADVLEVFGAPNITTRDGSGQEVWSYQRHATVAKSKEKDSFWTILLVGGSSKASGFSQTSRTMTLIIKFNADDVVSDFRSRTSDF